VDAFRRQLVDELEQLVRRKLSEEFSILLPEKQWILKV
jgi:hypothetical protein